MGSEQDVDVKIEAGSAEEQSSGGTGGRSGRLAALEGAAANQQEVKPQYTCSIDPPPTNTSGGEVQVPTPQYQCSVQKPPTNVSGG